MIILKSEIDSLFLHAWIQYHKITISQLELKPAKKTNQVQTGLMQQIFIHLYNCALYALFRSGSEIFAEID